jgi:4-amino-4-deoxy-L-arabinose transferase-like glycosyltransferase
MLRRASAWLAIAVAVIFIVAQASLLDVRIRDFDEGVYWQSIRALARGEPLFSSVFASQPPAFYYLLLPLYLVSHTLGSLRLTVLLIAVVGLGAMYLIARLVAGPIAGLVALALVAASPLYFHQSATVQADGPSVALSAASVALALLAVRDAGKRRLALAALSGLVLAFAIDIKLLAVVAAVAVAIVLLGEGEKRLASTLAAIGGGLIGAVIGLLPTITAPRVAFNDLIQTHLGAGHVGLQGISANIQILLMRRDVPIEALALLATIAALAVFDQRIVMPLAWLLASIAAVLAYHPLFLHHLAMLSVPLALVIAVGAVDIGRDGRFAAGAAAVMVVVTVGASSAAALSDVRFSFTPDFHNAEMSAAVRAASRPGDFWISDNPFAVGLADRDIPGPLVDPSLQRITSRLLTVDDLEAARRKYRIRWVLEDSFRLYKVRGYLDWLDEHYHAVEHLGGDAVIYESNSPD